MQGGSLMHTSSALASDGLYRQLGSMISASIKRRNLTRDEAKGLTFSGQRLSAEIEALISRLLKDNRVALSGVRKPARLPGFALSCGDRFKCWPSSHAAIKEAGDWIMVSVSGVTGNNFLSMLDNCRFLLNTQDEVVRSMPQYDGDGIEQVVFFRPNCKIKAGEISAVYNDRGLKPCNPFVLGTINMDETSLCESYPNATFWGGVRIPDEREYEYELPERNVADRGVCFTSYRKEASGRMATFSRLLAASPQEDLWFAGISLP